MTHQTIGFLGGTFDPIHCGHIHLAIQMMETHALDHVFFCPAQFSPYKSALFTKISGEQRYEMVKLAIEQIKEFTALDWEIRRPGPSYTIDTIRFLIAHAANRGQKIKLHLILGEDALSDFAHWKEVEELVALAPPLFGTRKLPGQPPFPADLPGNLSDAIEKGRTSIPLMEISSTEIRKRLLQEKFCGHLVPAKVLDYIHQHQLY